MSHHNSGIKLKERTMLSNIEGKTIPQVTFSTRNNEQWEKIKHDASADALSFSLQLTEMKEHHQTQLKQHKQQIKQLEQMLVNSGKGSDLKIFKQLYKHKSYQRTHHNTCRNYAWLEQW